VSRGVVRHTLKEDLCALAASIVSPTSCANAATQTEKYDLERAVSKRFSAINTVLFPYARTGVHAVLQAMHLPHGAEVLLTPITIGPMLEVIVSLGLRPTFVDIELDTFGPDLKDLKNKLQSRPAVFLLTYLFGYVPNIEAVFSACADSGVPVIEDISHNIGATYAGKSLGTFGIAGVYSASLLKYVDGYNGAFVITNNETMGVELSEAASRLTLPSKERVQGSIKRTCLWNFALNRLVFNFATFPALAILKVLSPARFEALLGPTIALNLGLTKLPEYYFEDITGLQCRTILKHLHKLDDLIKVRRDAAQLASQAWLEVTKGRTESVELLKDVTWANHTFWQFVIPVKNLDKARHTLFKSMVETSTTNLMDLAWSSGIKLPNAQRLKGFYLFLPLHERLSKKDYLKILFPLRKNELI